MPHVLLETFAIFTERRLIEIPAGGLRLHVGAGGRVCVLTPQVFCRTCNGSGGAVFFFDQDDKRGVACPTCADGSWKDWNEMHAQWKKHIKAS